MFIAAIAHKYSFPHDPYHINIPHYGSDRTWYNALMAMWDISDVQSDLYDHIGVVGSSLSRRIRGRTSYQLTRGSNERDYLIRGNAAILPVPPPMHQNVVQASGSTASTATLNSTKNRYGAFDSSHGVFNKNDAIAIVKQNAPAKDYSPQYGVPKAAGNYFLNQDQQSPSSSSVHNDKSSRSDNTSRSESAFEGGATGRTIKKSDSTASDWLSTPTDELMGIDVKGIEKDRINFKHDPRV